MKQLTAISCFLPKVFLPFFSVTIFVFYNNFAKFLVLWSLKATCTCGKVEKTSLILDILCDV